MHIEHATLSFDVLETKEELLDGSNIGVFSGYLAAFAKDRMGDVFLPGAFQESLKRHRDNDRPIRMLIQHSSEFLIGGFPIASIHEDAKGLFVVGNINLDVQRGKEAFSLMKQGVLTDMSIGYSIKETDGAEIKDGIRYLKNIEIWEGSLVTEPANIAARVAEVKTVVPFQDLPIASRDHIWDSFDAIGRVRKFTNSVEKPSIKYRLAFLWFDGENAKVFNAYELHVADVIEDRMTIVPRALFAAVAILQGARGGIDIPADDRFGVIRNVERYYAKMRIDSPFSKEEKQYFLAEDVKGWTERTIEKFLKKTGQMSKSAAKILSDRLEIKEEKEDNRIDEGICQLANEINNLRDDLRKII